MNNKKCKTCELLKPIIEFFTAAKYKDKQYYRKECKDCTRSELRSDKGRMAQIKYRNSELGKKNKNRHKKTEVYKEYQYEYERKRYYSDPFYRCKKITRERLLSALKRKNWAKKFKFAQYIGCSKEELINHFESKFTEGMTWENQGKWHIDHIIPLSSAKTEEEMYKLCHYTNLQPLWAADNIKKSNKIE